MYLVGQHVTKASGARLEFSLALAEVAVKVLKTTDRVIYHRMGGGGGSTVILSQQNIGLEKGGGGGGGIDCDSFTRIEVWRRGEGGGGGRSNVILSAKGFVGIASCSVGNCIVTSCLVVASTLFSMHCPGMLMVRINNSITILVTYFFDVFFPLNISCCN